MSYTFLPATILHNHSIGGSSGFHTHKVVDIALHVHSLHFLGRCVDDAENHSHLPVRLVPVAAHQTEADALLEVDLDMGVVVDDLVGELFRQIQGCKQPNISITTSITPEQLSVVAVSTLLHALQDDTDTVEIQSA